MDGLQRPGVFLVQGHRDGLAVKARRQHGDPRLDGLGDMLDLAALPLIAPVSTFLIC
jgi:hypothetical protein